MPRDDLFFEHEALAYLINATMLDSTAATCPMGLLVEPLRR